MLVLFFVFKFVGDIKCIWNLFFFCYCSKYCDFLNDKGYGILLKYKNCLK